MRTLIVLLMASVAFVPASGSAGALYSDAMLAEYFRVQWQASAAARGAAITGQIQNLATLPFDRIQLLVERLDAGGAVIGSSTTWVVGNLPANARTYFSATVPVAASYRVSIASFDWANCRD